MRRLVVYVNGECGIRDQPVLLAGTGAAVGEVPDAELAEGIIGPRWMTLEEIHASGSRHRSSLVVRCAEDAPAGGHYRLELLTHVGFGPHAA